MQILIFPIFLFPGCPVLLIQLAAINMQFGELIRQFVVFQYQLLSFCIPVVFDIGNLCRFIADIVL